MKKITAFINIEYCMYVLTPICSCHSHSHLPTIFFTVGCTFKEPGVQGGEHGQILLRSCTDVDISDSEPDKSGSHESRAVPIRLRTILSFIQSYKI